MAHTDMHHPIVLTSEQTRRMSRGIDEWVAPTPEEDARQRQTIGHPVPASRSRGRDRGAGAERGDDQAEAGALCLPPECWYG